MDHRQSRSMRDRHRMTVIVIRAQNNRGVEEIKNDADTM
jgi:hypothetical protein